MRYSYLALCLFVTIGAACREEPTVPLATLAVPAPDVSTAPVAPLPSPMVAAVTVRHPGRLVAIVRPLLGLADDVKSAALIADELEQFSGLYGEISQLSLLFDESAGQPALASFSGFLALRPAAGSKAVDLLARWSPRLALLPAWPDGRQTVCLPREGLLLCGPGEGAPTEDFVGRARAAMEGTTSEVSLTVDLPRLLTIAEELVTVPLLWAVVPEEARKFATLRLALTESPDRFSLELMTRESGLVEAFVQLFELVGKPIIVPQATAAVAFTAVQDLAARLEKVQDFWDNKIPLAKGQKLQALLNDSWQSQMMELASGLSGVLLIGDVPLTGLDPAAPLQTPGLVYFIQVTDTEAMEARLLHVFNTKYFKLEDENFEGLVKFTHAFWKKKKNKATRERLSWFVEGETGTYYFGMSEVLIRFIHEREAARAAGTTMELALAPGEVARFALSPGGLVGHLTASQKAGLSAAMALGMVKNTLGAVVGEIVVRVLHRVEEDGGHTASFEVEGLLSTLKDAITRSESLLKMLPAAQ